MRELCIVHRMARVTLEPASRSVSINGQPLELTTIEYEILARLVQSAGTVISREQLIAEVFERQPYVEDRALDVHISHLRKKLGHHASLIVTVRGVGHMLRTSGPVVLALLMLALLANPAAAQEDIEPRTVGGRGVMSIGVAGFIDKVSSSEETFPTHLTLHVDVNRFLTGRFAVRGGVIGSTTFGDDDEVPTGPGAAALHAFGGLFYYFTPQSILSAYAGGEYRAQLTHRAERDSGTMLGIGGVQATLSSRASVFVQGGFGRRLTRGDEDELQTRIAGEIGLRFKF